MEQCYLFGIQLNQNAQRIYTSLDCHLF